MTLQEKTAVLQNLMQLLHDSLGNRLSVTQANGISVTHGQFLDTLLEKDAEPPKE